MKQIVSRYVREQKRYTKKNLKDKFEFHDNELGLDNFIKNLKAFGIMKTVNNESEQLEMSDLVEDDIEISDETAESGECLYVFTYVGIITCGNRIVKVYPKYLLSKVDDPLDEMKQVIKVLEKYSRSDEQIINVFNGNGDNRSFNLLAVILFLLNDYYEYGIYTNTEDIIEINGEGEILWGKTIDEGLAYIDNNRPYYMELYTAKTVDDDADFFQRLHEVVLTDCFNQLREAQLDELFGMDYLVLNEETISDLGETEYILERILKELNVQYNTRRQILLKTLYAYISQNKRMTEETDGISMFGTTAYHAVWEKVCAEVFDNKLGKRLDKLNLPDETHVDYQIEGTKTLIEIIEKPIWRRNNITMRATETLRPDLISIYEKDDKKYFIIFDAKYYNLCLEHGKLSGNPGIGDIDKQYLYQLAYLDFINKYKFAGVRNCFLMPTEEEQIIDMGTVTMTMLERLNLANIQVRKLSASRLYDLYLAGKKMDIAELKLFE